MLAFTRAIIALRRSSAALRGGDFTLLDAPEPLLAFERRHASERMACVFNLGAQPMRWPLLAQPKTVRLTSGDAVLAENEAVLGAYSSLLLEM